MLKRFLHNFSDAATRGAGYVVGGRGGNDLYGWVKSGEAKKAIGRLGKDAAEVAREAKDALASAGEEAGHAIQEGVQGLRGRFSAGDGAERGEREEERQARADAEASAEAELSEDDRAALQARQRAMAAGITVRCTHCDAPVRVAPDAELAKCTSCDRRFWVELAERD